METEEEPLPELHLDLKDGVPSKFSKVIFIYFFKLFMCVLASAISSLCMNCEE